MSFCSRTDPTASGRAADVRKLSSRDDGLVGGVKTLNWVLKMLHGYEHVGNRKACKVAKLL